MSGSQSSPYTAFSLGQVCFSSCTPMPFKHICGYITLYICDSGHQIILKSLQFTNHVRIDNSIICLILPTIAVLIHWADIGIYTLIHSSGTSIYTDSYPQLPSPQQSTGGSIPSILAAIVLPRPTSSSRWPFTTLCKHCLLRCGSLCFQHK